MEKGAETGPKSQWSRVLHWRDWSINVRLALTLFLAALIPMTLTAWYNLQGSLNSVEDTAYQNMELVARNTASQIDQLMVDTRYVAVQMGGDATIQQYLANPTDEGYDAAVAALDNVLYSNPNYEYTYILDSTGTVLISRQTGDFPSIQDKNFSTRAYFTSSIGGSEYIDILVGTQSRQLGLYFSAPIRDDNDAVIGVAAIKIGADTIAEIVNALKVGDEGYAFIVDQDGVVVIHPDASLNYRSLAPLTREEEIRVGRRFVRDGCTPDDEATWDTTCFVPNLGLDDLASKLQSGSEGYASYTYGDNARRIAGFAPLSEISWEVVVSQPYEEFSAPLNSLARQSALSVVIVGLLALAIGVAQARTIARPIRKLAHVARDVERDKPFKPDDLSDVITGENELSNLARVFSNMVVSLRARMTDLRTIYEIGNSISSSVELRPTLYYLIRALAQAVPHDGAEICLYNKDNNQMIMNLSVGKNVGQTLTTSRTYEITGFLTDLVGKQTVMVRDMAQVENAEQNEPRAWQQFKPRSYLGVPLVAKNKVIGTIELVSSQPDGFSEDNKRILESIAIQAAIAIQNAQEVETREKDLKQQIVLLKIEVDEAKKSRQVSEIVESEYFQILRQKAKDMRAKRE